MTVSTLPQVPDVVSTKRAHYCPFRGFCVERLKILMCVRLFVRLSVRPDLFWTLSEPTFASFKAILHFWCPKRGPFCDIWTKLTQIGPSICNIALKEAKVCQNEALYTKAPKGATLPCRCNLVYRRLQIFQCSGFRSEQTRRVFVES